MKTGTTTAAKTPSQKKQRKYVKIIIICAVTIIFVTVGIILLVKLTKKETSTKITTYNVEAVTYGNVTQTISGSGTLTPVTKETLKTAVGGEIESVNYTVGDEVTEGAVIAVIGGEEITAPFDGILLELPLTAGKEATPGSSAAMVMGKDGFTMGIAVDETEISSVAMGQEVSFTIDALNKTASGSVTAISYNGSSSGGTVAFQITATVEYIEGVYPGMSASAKIVIEDSGEGLLVPVSAVKTSGDTKYVTIAPEGAEDGKIYQEGELDTSKLEVAVVTTGMSDGSYMIVESDSLSEGTLIVITTVTSTQTGSEKEETENSFGNMGGMGDFGNFGGNGMDFGDFDFSDFDPGQFPSGGFSFGN